MLCTDGCRFTDDQWVLILDALWNTNLTRTIWIHDLQYKIEDRENPLYMKKRLGNVFFNRHQWDQGKFYVYSKTKSTSFIPASIIDNWMIAKSIRLNITKEIFQKHVEQSRHKNKNICTKAQHLYLKQQHYKRPQNRHVQHLMTRLHT